MAWIESHQSLGRHPKLLRLAEKLRINKAQALGHLQYLWWWALDYAPTGDVSGLAPGELATASEWQGDPSLFQKSMKECGWIDQDGNIHDWMDYAGRLVEERKKDAERKRLSRIASAGHPADGGRTAPVPNPTLPNPTVPNPTVPNPTVPNPTVQNQNQKIKHSAPAPFTQPKIEEIQEFIRSNRYDVEAERFMAFYESNGWMVGRNRMKNWKAAVRTWHFNPKGGSNGNGNARIGATPVPGKYANISRS